MKTVAVIYGGKSGEHEVSLISASSVIRNIDRKKFNIELIGITKNGKWFLQDSTELERILSDKDAVLKIVQKEENALSVIPAGKNNCFSCRASTLDVDIVFPVVHGTFCEDGTLQGLLDMAEVAYVGCGCMSSALTMDKEKTKAVWKEAGLSVVPYILMTRAELNDSKKYDEIFSRAVSELGFPLFVKPCNAGSSVGAGKANSEKELSMALMEAFLWDNKVLIEKAVNAKEIECSVTGISTCESPDNSCSVVKAYLPGEILPTHEFYDYDAKYTDPDGAKLKIPAEITEEQIAEIQQIAVKAYKAVDASGLSRVDFFVDKTNGKIYLNEINTLPGFTSISMFPKMCEASGLKYSDLIELLLDEAVIRHSARMQLQTSL